MHYRLYLSGIALLWAGMNALPANAQGVLPAGGPLGLRQALNQAELRNPQLVVAQRNLGLGLAGITAAGSTPNPQLTVYWGFGTVYTEDGSPQTIGLSQKIETAGKRPARLALADAQYRLVLLQYNATRFEVRSQVRKAYAQFAAAQAGGRALEVQERLAQRLLEVARKRSAAGESPKTDALQTQLEVNRLKTQQTEALGRVEQAQIALSGLLGRDPEETLDIDDLGLFELSLEKTALVPLPSAPVPLVATFLERAYRARLDLQAAEQQREVARRQLDLARAQRVPDVDVAAGYLFTTRTNRDPQAQGVYLGLGIDLPVFYNNQGEVKLAELAGEQSSLQIDALKLQIAVEVRTAYRALLNARESLRRHRNQLLPAAQDVVQLTQLSYELGKRDLGEVILAQQAAQEVLESYLEAVVAYQGAWADLERAVGEPLDA
ncbi:TolC family protein [Gloeobacter morelensis]|uniref:TolC family protein n=1 Tax=Gloeobacter morelensis MG652769 TaxID=2781736 RepID=A0ABY3PNJ8_9CYAN|nr:TolC family protein [Gloeobacter morelensis]UFP95199.1 TolC family protein [Gloeobacter morelensis MG652769]